jgi:predicted DNA-binding transcriptional regulator AlpA
MREQTPHYLTDNQLAARLQISRNSVWRLVKTGQLPQPIKLFASTTRWKLSDIQEFERAAEERTARAG